MTLDEDAERATIKMARLAVTENACAPSSAGMFGVMVDMFDHHDYEGVERLCLALARHYAAALVALAACEGRPVDEMVDMVERQRVRAGGASPSISSRSHISTPYPTRPV